MNQSNQTNERPIILLDLNYTLAENSRAVLQKGRIYNVGVENYRPWLRDLLRDFYVILITVRPSKYREETIMRIWNELKWQPDEAWFNEWGYHAPRCKEMVINRSVFPKHGQPDATWYLAIESNDDTAAMYATYGISRHRANDIRNAPALLTQGGEMSPRLF